MEAKDPAIDRGAFGFGAQVDRTRKAREPFRPSPRAVLAAKAATGIVAACALGAAAVAFGPQAWAFFTNGDAVRDFVEAQGPWAPLAMAGLVAAQIVVAVLPGEPIELASGYLFGFWEGTGICLLGSLAGTCLVTLFVKLFGMRVVRLFFSQERIESVSWLRDSARFEAVIFMVFLIPGTPKDVLTYVAGLSGCPWWRIAAITTVGRIPSVITSTLAAGFASSGNWIAAAVTVGVTLALVALGAVLYVKVVRRSSAK